MTNDTGIKALSIGLTKKVGSGEAAAAIVRISQVLRQLKAKKKIQDDQIQAQESKGRGRQLLSQKRVFTTP